MPIIKINQLPEGSGNLSDDDVFVFMDDPSGGGTTKKISLSEISSSIFDQDLNTFNNVTFNQMTIGGSGTTSYNVNINTNAGSWAFNTDGTVDLPSSTLNVGVNSLDLKSSAYLEFYYQSGPSGTSNNYIEVPNNNSYAYLWTTYDGTHIQNIRTDDGTNPSWSHEWHFNNSGTLILPTSGSITFPDNTTQTSAGIPSSTGLVPNSTSITNIVSISQANYDAIVTKDSTTLYVIS